MKVLTIGDPHGLDTWKESTHGTVGMHHDWKCGADSMLPADFQYPFEQFDRVVFVGDYVDSFTVPNPVILQNLLHIIEFKSVEPDRVVLLLGNHDVQYFVAHTICDGYRPAMRPDLYDVFMKNIGLFKLAHSERDSSGRIHLWTHAGLTAGWYALLKDKLFDDAYRFRDETVALESEEDPAVLLNFAWERRGDCQDILFNVDSDSHGFSRWASPLWVRPERLNHFAVGQVNQIVGHTPCSEPWRHVIEGAGEPFWIQYVDCLDRGLTHELDI
jgi:Calcineurin-like phosphoesterase